MSKQPFFHPQGIYLGMSDDEYHKDCSLSQSGMKDLRISPLTYWINSRLNPDREEGTSGAQTIGKAFHKRILEGKVAFESAFAEDINASDYPNALKSATDLRERCGELGLKKSGTLVEMSARIREVDSGIELWTEIEESHQTLHNGKEFLSKPVMKRVELAAKSIEANDAIKPLVRNGFSEVAIFWVDPRTKTRMKCKVDYLTAANITELKSFSNSQGVPLAQAVGRAIVNYGYGLQAVTYMEAVEQAKLMIAQRGEAAITLCNGFTCDWLSDWLKFFSATKEHRFTFLFQESGSVPNVLARSFSKESNYYDIMRFDYEFYARKYQEFVARWGLDQPWIDPVEIIDLQDEELPVWAFN